MQPEDSRHAIAATAAAAAVEWQIMQIDLAGVAAQCTWAICLLERLAAPSLWQALEKGSTAGRMCTDGRMVGWLIVAGLMTCNCNKKPPT